MSLKEPSVGPLAAVEEIRNSWGWFRRRQCYLRHRAGLWMAAVDQRHRRSHPWLSHSHLERLPALAPQRPIPGIHRIFAHSLSGGRSSIPHPDSGLLLHRGRSLQSHWRRDVEVSPLGMVRLLGCRLGGAGDHVAGADASFQPVVHWLCYSKGVMSWKEC